MYTSLMLIALAGASPSPAVPDPSWQDDYATGRKLGRKERKPLAVFVGAGREGWGQVSETGKFSPEAKRLLADRFVCVYLNRARPSGWRVASAFRMNGGPGLVISSPDGEDQAFRHEGTLSRSELERTLRKYANPRRVVTRTETLGGTVQVSGYYSPNQDGTTLQPTTPVAAGVVAPTIPVGGPPMMGFGGFGGGFGGGGGRGGC